MSTHCPSIRRLALVVTLLGIGLAGCRSAGTVATSGSRTLLSLTEIEAGTMRYANAYELVRARRPHWLSNLRGEILVFYNGQNYGGPDALRDFTLNGIREVEYVGLENSYRYTQSDRPTVVILVTSR